MRIFLELNVDKTNETRTVLRQNADDVSNLKHDDPVEIIDTLRNPGPVS